jgi:heptosyltransferase-2
MTSSSASRVLILKFGAIGDVVMAIPAAHALHQRGAEIDWVCGPAVAPLLACYPWIRTIVADDRAILKGSAGERMATLAKLWRVLGGKKYDLCATLYYDRRYRLLALPVRAKRKVMLSRTERENRLIAVRHHSDEYKRILLSEEDTCRSESVKPLRPERLPVCSLPERKALVRVGLVPGGASNMMRQQILRRWPVASYVKLARELLVRGYEVVLLGGPDDSWIRPEFADLAEVGLPLLDAIGTLSLPEVISACDTCDVVVSHDTGPMHLAGLSRAALIGLFGPTDPGNFLPRREGVRGIWGGEGFACRPCYDGRDFASCRDNGCMQQMTTGMVLRQMDELLAERATGAVGPQLVVLPSSMKGSG